MRACSDEVVIDVSVSVPVRVRACTCVVCEHVCVLQLAKLLETLMAILSPRRGAARDSSAPPSILLEYLHCA